MDPQALNRSLRELIDSDNHLNRLNNAYTSVRASVRAAGSQLVARRASPAEKDEAFFKALLKVLKSVQARDVAMQWISGFVQSVCKVNAPMASPTIVDLSKCC